jgi:hypothetical protein
MIIDVWRPIFTKINNKKVIDYYEITDPQKCFLEKKQGYKIRYICDECNSNKINITRSGVLISEKYALNKLSYQVCRSCRSRISEYETKKNFINFDIIKKSIQESNYIILTDEQEYMCSTNRSQFKIDVVCDKGHDLKVTWNNWSKGKRCKQCYEKNKFENAIKYKQGWEEYLFLVWHYSEISYRQHRNSINPNKYRRGKKYHLDHIYSISDGFVNNVTPEKIGNYKNLRVITAQENLKKNKKSLMTLEEINNI